MQFSLASLPVMQDGAQWGDVAHGLKNLLGFRSQLANDLQASLFNNNNSERERDNAR